ncbi:MULTISPECIES: hypothetical protein [unclassified Nocardia]|uniref:hypothetical protein n=1 Tax=unclassified Nocardia TaxID=2637762 RepID=UPI0024A87FFB|nr:MULTISPECIES: hypothetical protein [unclassified Nocardia]
METPELAELIRLFEGEPDTRYDDLHWPVGLHGFRLTRGVTTVLFSIDPSAAEAYVSLYVDDMEIVHIGRLRRLSHLTVVRDGSGGEGLRLWFRDNDIELLELTTKPKIRVSWSPKPIGSW